MTDPASGDLESIAVSPDGELTTGHFDGSSYLWNLGTGQRIATVTEPITNAAIAAEAA